MAENQKNDDVQVKAKPGPKAKVEQTIFDGPANERPEDAPQNNTPDPENTDPEAVAEQVSPSVLQSTTVNRSHTVVFGDNGSKPEVRVHVGSNGQVNNFSENDLRRIMDGAGYKVVDVVDD